ncbi:MAG: hypothetical protein U0X41_11600 [Chitinophagales bacterium]
MYKYKDFLLFFCAIAVLLLWFLFPVSFDNNDDQTMYAICSGMISGTSSSGILLSHVFIGRFLTAAFSFSKKINWYTLYLQGALLFSFLYVCRFFIRKNATSFLTILFVVLIVFLGFYSLAIVKLQFTTVALFCCFSALFSLQSDDKPPIKISSAIFFLAVAILIRKDVFYVFLLFCIPLFFAKKSSRHSIRETGLTLLFAVLFFAASVWLNNSNETYRQYSTYSNVQALDMIAARPVKVEETKLKEYGFSLNDISLLQSWLVADDAYLSGEKMLRLAKGLKAYRGPAEIMTELKKFVTDERYLLMLYLLTILFIVVFAPDVRNSSIANLLLFSVFLLFLTVMSRIPHRVTFPILTYLILLNVASMSDLERKSSVQAVAMTSLLLLSGYKFYCTAKLIPVHKENHIVFDACKAEINAHPQSLFIAADGFPLQYMDAWQTPENAFSAHNLILGGWYACTPDYQAVLKLKGLRNITSAMLPVKQQVYFLTDSQVLQDSYIQVMRERYHIKCHFEAQYDGFKVLRPKRLVFDN